MHVHQISCSEHMFELKDIFPPKMFPRPRMFLEHRGEIVIYHCSLCHSSSASDFTKNICHSHQLFWNLSTSSSHQAHDVQVWFQQPWDLIRNGRCITSEKAAGGVWASWWWWDMRTMTKNKMFENHVSESIWMLVLWKFWNQKTCCNFCESPSVEAKQFTSCSDLIIFIPLVQ